MPLRPVQVNLKALAPASLGEFWAAALGWRVHALQTVYVAPDGPFTWPQPGGGIGLDVVGVSAPEPAAKNGVHLDLASDSPARQAELVARLRDLGATDADVGQGDDVPWTVLADPEGNEFCVLA